MRRLLIFVLMFFGGGLFAQTQFETKSFNVPRKKVISPKEITPTYNAQINHLEAPKPGGDSYRSFLLSQKQASREFFRANPYLKSNESKSTKSAQQPAVGVEHHPKRILSNGSEVELYAGIPSDNTVAVSNDGIALMGMNVLLYAYDLKKDTSVFDDQFVYLRPFIDGLSTSNYYDPKVIYDPVEDRFIVVFLKDSSPEKSELIVCFSSSSDINEDWYVYYLPGNPLENNRWTDFPAISITEDKLYFTANLIVPDTTWQVGFDGSLIWEMDKNKGFEGANDIDATLYHSISYNNGFVRNIHAVQGADGWAEEAYFLSNRNFDILNDTLFFIHLNEGNIEVKPLITNVPYGVPPNARQQDTDTSDATNGLQTNDARVLGAILFEDEIQFVGNTIYPPTGFSAIYHGTITNISDQAQVHGHIIHDTKKDYAYPNIAWVGNEACDRETMIAFNSSSFDHFPSIEAVYFNNEGIHSDPLLIKEGFNYVDRLPGGYERWGDYFGLQRDYSNPGKAISFGYLALQTKSNGGYLAELISPDSSKMEIDFVVEYRDLCENRIEANVKQGVPPFTYFWQGDTLGNSLNSIEGYCAKDTITVTVIDDRGCSTSKSFVVDERSKDFQSSVFPNPADDLLAVKFNLQEDAEVKAEIYHLNGKKVDEVSVLPAKSGSNEFIFSIAPLSPGNYQLVLSSNNEIIETFRFIKGK